MKKQELLDRTGRYLEDYLADFAEEGRASDARHFRFGIEIPAYQARMDPEDVDTIDLHLTRFNQIYRSLQQASLKGFIDAVSRIEDVIVIDICSLYGERFGLWVASENPTADVHVHNPEVPGEDFALFLFNQHNRGKIWKFHTKPKFDVSDPEGSINELYGVNGFTNISFHLDAMDAEGMDRYCRENPRRKVVFVAERINDLVQPIAGAVARNPSAEMVIAPLINLDVRNYLDDQTMLLIDKYRHIRQGQTASDTHRPSANVRTRLFTMMQQYYSLKAALEAGGKAEVYAATELERGFPFHHPTHYVSTIEHLRGKTQE
ncbi:MAG: hypothetical protein KKD17_00020 [Nanoarchaeota archaeon]|nr:hypothetical protein [Nanoarchaeota archaeon]